jgi:alkaline phosphatase D
MRYSQLGDSAVFQTFRANVPMLVTWDDHDFGYNNSAGNFVNKAISKDVFFNFWNLPKSGKRWERNGIYDSYYYGDADHRLQIIFLDLRWGLDYPGPEPISILSDTTKKMMSNEQWTWLKEELKKPAKIRIICSSTQFCTEHNGFEAWANFPHEQERMYQTLRDAKAEGAFIISGDLHATEINKRLPTALYPLYDFTSSPLAMPLHGNNTRPSIYRVGNYVDRDNFGILDINWNGASSQVTFTAFDSIGSQLITKTISVSDLKF